MNSLKRAPLIIAAVCAILVVSMVVVPSEKPLFRATSKAQALNTFATLANRESLIYPNWTASTWLNRSDHMLVYFSRPNTEGVVAGEDGVLARMFVNIVDPQDGITTFNVSFKTTAFSRAVARNDGGLIVENPQDTLDDIGGEARYSGEYMVQVYTHPELVASYYPDNSTMGLLEIDVHLDARYTVTVRYLGDEPLYNVVLRSLDVEPVLDSQTVLEQDGILSFTSCSWRTHVVVSWAGGSETIRVEDPA